MLDPAGRLALPADHGKGGAMSQISVTVNGHPYKIACDDGQEPRIRRLAQYVDARVGEFVKRVGQVGEARLLLLAALVIADELSDANEALAQEQSRGRAAETAAEDAVETAAGGIHGLAQRIEAIAARLERP
jgi:cell division protein ZapA